MKEIKEVKRNPANRKFYQKNFNPWDFNIADCVVRAIVAALMMKYEFVVEIAAQSAGDQIENMSKTCKYVSSLNLDEVIRDFQKEDKYFGSKETVNGT